MEQGCCVCNREPYRLNSEKVKAGIPSELSLTAIPQELDDQDSNQVKEEVIQLTYQDKQLICYDCQGTYTFSIGEQEEFATRGYTNDPKRCQPCRDKRKQRIGVSSNSGNRNFGSSAPRQMFPAVCATCGQATQVPFQPRGDRPVYCSDCYRKTNPVRRTYN